MDELFLRLSLDRHCVLPVSLTENIGRHGPGGSPFPPADSTCLGRDVRPSLPNPGGPGFRAMAEGRGREEAPPCRASLTCTVPAFGGDTTPSCRASCTCTPSKSALPTFVPCETPYNGRLSPRLSPDRQRRAWWTAKKTSPPRVRRCGPGVPHLDRRVIREGPALLRPASSREVDPAAGAVVGAVRELEAVMSLRELPCGFDALSRRCARR